jgi:uncharacterized protein (TIGR02996 family)
MINPQSSFSEMLADPDERRFCLAILNDPNDDALKLEYAQRLEEVADPRGEFLRLECLLAGPEPRGPIPPGLQTRYRELVDQVSRYHWWLLIVKRNDRILNCGSAARQQLAVRFRYECPNQWESLAPTPEVGVRYCKDCQRNVFFCDSAESAEQHARAGDCITVPRRVTASVGKELTQVITGMPDVHALWGEKLFGG